MPFLENKLLVDKTLVLQNLCETYIISYLLYRLYKKIRRRTLQWYHCQLIDLWSAAATIIIIIITITIIIINVCY